MPLYEYCCACGEQVEVLARSSDEPPPCPSCTLTMHRRISTFSVGGRAGAGPSMADAPRTWEQTNHGDRETITHWRHTLDRRAELEERHPELEQERNPVLAHEGKYADAPLHVHKHPPAGGAGAV